MRLTLQTDYALRVLMYVATKAEERSTIPEVVDRFDISKGHVMKVVHRLGQLGYVDTTRGKRGGIRLGRKAELINIGAVIRDMENELGVVGCLQGIVGYCRIETCCVLRKALRDATSAFLMTLDGYTLADLMKPRRTLGRLLEIDAAASHRRQNRTVAS